MGPGGNSVFEDFDFFGKELLGIFGGCWKGIGDSGSILEKKAGDLHPDIGDNLVLQTPDLAPGFMEYLIRLLVEVGQAFQRDRLSLSVPFLLDQEAKAGKKEELTAVSLSDLQLFTDNRRETNKKAIVDFYDLSRLRHTKKSPSERGRRGWRGLNISVDDRTSNEGRQGVSE